MKSPAQPRIFRPIGPAAKSGGFRLLVDDQGHQHSGRWDAARGCFTYAGGAPIGREIVKFLPKAEDLVWEAGQNAAQGAAA